MFGTCFKLALNCYLINHCSCYTNLRTHDDLHLLRRTEDVNAEHSRHNHIFREIMPRLSSRSDILSQSRADPAYLHKVIFVIRQKNMDQLTAILHSVSDPLSSSYGNHLTKEEIDKMTFNENSRDAVVSYLQSTGTTIVSESLNGEYITAEASIESWEKIFHAEFYIFHQKHQDGRVEKLVRAEKYWIPKELDAHVESVFKVVEMPLISSGKLPKLFPTPTSGSSSGSGSRSVNIETVTINKITPAIIRKFYNVSSTATGSSYSTQAIFATIGQYMSSSDLLSFQTNQNLTKQNIFYSIGNHVSSTYCLNDPGNCAEGNLDTQYIMSMSPLSRTIYWYTDLSFSDFLVSVSNTLSPPLVISISYGQEEDYTTDSELLAFNTQSIKLGAMGVTILVASGDDGATSRLVRTSGPSMCRYSPSFPATSPYVISVGATSGPESNTPEVVCEGNVSTITSGGGFSRFFQRPDFQLSSVLSFFTSAVAAGHKPMSGYGLGRGYPDISLAGYNYYTVIGGQFHLLSGTSASCPTLAGLISNINSDRIKINKGSLGWLNPTIYLYSNLFTNDITSGNNLCVAKDICCPQGFFATPGWDPTTGLGSINYGNFHDKLVSLGTVNILTSFPSLDPTLFPTSAPFTERSSVVSVIAIVGGVVGGVIFIIAVIVIILCCRKTHQ